MLREAGSGDLRGCSGWLASLASRRVQSSDLTQVPLASHPLVTLPAQEVCLKSFHKQASCILASATHLDSSLKVCLDLTQGV